MSSTETVSAHQLVRGDVVHVPDQEGWYVVSSAFQEGSGGPMDLDLYGESSQDGFSWNADPEELVERRIELI